MTLTDAVRPHLFGADRRPALEVIPCCADLERLEEQSGAGATPSARELGLGDRRVMVYVGKFTGWYMEREMVDFFAAARRAGPRSRVPGAHAGRPARSSARAGARRHP